MEPSAYDDPFAFDEPGAADDDAPENDDDEAPPAGPGRPYGVYPAPAGLVRDPSQPVTESARTPAPKRGRPPGGATSRPNDTPAGAAGPDGNRAPGDGAHAPPGGAKPLRPRQERFCQLYVVLGNATQAALQAGYSFPASRNQGYRLLRRSGIQSRIAELQRELTRALEMDAEVMLGKLEAVYHRAIEGGYLNAAARVVEVQARIAGGLRGRRAPPSVPGDNEE